MRNVATVAAQLSTIQFCCSALRLEAEALPIKATLELGLGTSGVIKRICCEDDLAGVEGTTSLRGKTILPSGRDAFSEHRLLSLLLSPLHPPLIGSLLLLLHCAILILLHFFDIVFERSRLLCNHVAWIHVCHSHVESTINQHNEPINSYTFYPYQNRTLAAV